MQLSLYVKANASFIFVNQSQNPDPGRIGSQSLNELTRLVRGSQSHGAGSERRIKQLTLKTSASFIDAL